MSSNKKINSLKGFTIVELLVVIVVIGILAAITTVSYTGITSKARTASREQLANNIIKKANLYQTEGTTLNWPVTAALAMSATPSSAALPTAGVTVLTSVPTSANTEDKVFAYQLCGTTSSTTAVTAPVSYATITNPTGVIVSYWNLSTNAVVSMPAGNSTAGAVGPYKHTDGTTYNNLVACYYSAT